MPLARRMNQYSQPVDLLDSVVRDGNASNGHAISMTEYVAAGVRARTKDSVGAIGIADMQAQEKIALRIEPIEFVETLLHLHITKFSFRPKHAGSLANRVGVHQSIRIFRVIRCPKF